MNSRKDSPKIAGLQRSPTPVELSIIIPAYNEESRLKATLASILERLPSLSGGENWEVIVADDGSTDRTRDLVRDLIAEDERLQILNLAHRGKGAAVRSGMLAARGQFLLFSDADLATPISEAQKLLLALMDGADVAVGSRAAEGALRLNEPLYREAMGRAFHLAIQWLLMHEFTDTQCGFKAFRRDAARDIFQRLSLYNDDSPVLTHPAVTGFDVEVLYLAVRLGYRIVEIPVEWHYQAESKVNPLRDSYLLFRDVLTVRKNARRNAYDLGVINTQTTSDEPSISADMETGTHVTR